MSAAELARELHDAAITLENDRKFYEAYQHSQPVYSSRRNLIHDHTKRLGCVVGEQHHREQLRRYFDSTIAASTAYKVTTDNGAPANSSYHVKTIEFWKDEVKFPEQPRSPPKEPSMACSFTHAFKQPTPKEEIMNTAIKITTKTFANDKDIANMSDADIYSLISNQEAEIKSLLAIGNKPKRLLAEIAEREAGIAALVAHLDSKV
jgi:hypothetical protein